MRPIAVATMGRITGVGIQPLSLLTRGYRTVAIIPPVNVIPGFYQNWGAGGGLGRDWSKHGQGLETKPQMEQHESLTQQILREDDEMLLILMRFLEVV